MKAMKTLVLFAALALFAVNTNASLFNTVNMTTCCGGEDELSTMTIKVKKVVGHEDKAEALKTDLMNVQGIKEVKTCMQSGTVTISYDKAQMGCCSKIHTALKDGKWKYQTVSDETKPGCAGKSGKSCTKGEQKQCTGMKKGA